MNEQLKEIAIKAQVEHCVSHVRLEKFAELIVRECTNLIDKHTTESYSVSNPIRINTLINNHFGIKS